MMKTYLCVAAATVLIISPVLAQRQPPALVYESSKEFFGTGDFDGDGRPDLVIVDKDTGKFRLGYQTAAGGVTWVDSRASGLKGLSGFNIGKVLDPKLDGLAFSVAEGNQLGLCEAASVTAPGKPVLIAFSAALGPSTVIPTDGGALAKRGLLDLYVASVYNSPEQNLITLLRNDSAEFPKVTEETLPGAGVHGNHVALKTGQTELACFLVTEEKGDTFRAEDLRSGKPVTVVTLSGLPAGCDYTAGTFRNSPLCEFLFYKPGQSQLLFRPVEESGSQLQIGKGAQYDLGQPIRRVVALAQAAGQKLFVIFGEGESAALFDFDGSKAPTSVQTFTATNEQFTCAANLSAGFVAYLQPTGAKYSTKYQVYNWSGAGCTAGAFGTLPSLADNDNVTIPDIYSRITERLTVTNATDMKPYTNVIPGTAVPYVMLPIPGGEFEMGSPDSEAGRKPDEGPQHKVKIEPFWMEQCEVTWSEYELFMYNDEERRMRSTLPTDAAADKIADAVTHPSKPYVEMSFGMGKEGYPAISMTHHAANKYCQWLSAKTGQFYRLPTEAEWEYACRAGTTTAYFFGNDPGKLGDYAWFEQNSDFKYQKVGKKKPNPWGLYDVYGNVLEWVLDQYDPDYYKQCASQGVVEEPWNKATRPYPHSARGGSWDDEAVKCRSAARRGSERAWKMTDPQLPKSIWYLSDAQWIGFRIIRPLKVPPPEELQKYWTSGTERD